MMNTDVVSETNSEIQRNAYERERVSSMSTPSLQKRKQILLIEDDADFSDLLSGAIRSILEISVETAADPFEAMEKISEGGYDAIILDWNLPPMTGAEALRRMEVSLFFASDLPEKWEGAPVPVVVISAHTEKHLNLQDSMHFRMAGFVSKRQGLPAFLEQLQGKLSGLFDFDQTA